MSRNRKNKREMTIIKLVVRDIWRDVMVEGELKRKREIER